MQVYQYLYLEEQTMGIDVEFCLCVINIHPEIKIRKKNPHHLIKEYTCNKYLLLMFNHYLSNCVLYF